MASLEILKRLNTVVSPQTEYVSNRRKILQLLDGKKRLGKKNRKVCCPSYGEDKKGSGKSL